jgi:asparagine synthase (glutamine-hydrolysing)
MSASIEVRVPFVDHMLHDVVDRLADEDRYEPVRSKSMLRRVGLGGLDPALFDRPKTGFELPIERWLRSNLGRQVDATLRDPELVAPTGLNPQPVARLWDAFLEGAPGLYWTRIWALYVLIRWCHRHRVYL